MLLDSPAVYDDKNDDHPPKPLLLAIPSRNKQPDAPPPVHVRRPAVLDDDDGPGDASLPESPDARYSRSAAFLDVYRFVVVSNPPETAATRGLASKSLKSPPMGWVRRVPRDSDEPCCSRGTSGEGLWAVRLPVAKYRFVSGSKPPATLVTRGEAKKSFRSPSIGWDRRVDRASELESWEGGRGDVPNERLRASLRAEVRPRLRSVGRGLLDSAWVGESDLSREVQVRKSTRHGAKRMGRTWSAVQLRASPRATSSSRPPMLEEGVQEAVKGRGGNAAVYSAGC